MTKLMTLLLASVLVASAQITSIPSAAGAAPGGAVGGASTLTTVGATLKTASAGVAGEVSTTAAINSTSAGRLQVSQPGSTGKWGGLDLGSLYVNALATPGAPTVTPTCTGTCATTYTYACVAKAGDGTTTVMGATASTLVNAAALDATHFNTVTCPAVTGASYQNVRRTVGGAAQGNLATCTGNAYGTACVDVGLVGDASAAPAENNTGQVTAYNTITTESFLRAKLSAYVDPSFPLGSSIQHGALSFPISSGATPGQVYMLSNWSCPLPTGCDYFLRTGGSAGIFMNITDQGAEGGPGDISFWTAPSGTAATHIPWAQSMQIAAATGNVGIKTAFPLTAFDSNGSIRVTGSPTVAALTGTADPTASTTLVGTGTLFLTELVVGDRITVNAETRAVTAIATNLSLTVDSAFTDTAGGAAITKLPTIFVNRDSSGVVKSFMDNRGYMGVGTGTASSGSTLETGKFSVTGAYFATNGQNGLHFGFGSNIASIQAIQEGTAYRSLRLNGLDIYLNATSLGPVIAGGTVSAAPGGTVPAWKAYTVLKIANGANGCTNANGCWQVNGARVADAAASPAQNVPIIPTTVANMSVSDIRIKTAVACVNAAGTLQLTDVGLTGTAGFYATGLTYDLEAAVADTNILYPTLAARGNNTAAATGLTATVTAGTGNIDGVADGCSFVVNLLWGVVQ